MPQAELKEKLTKMYDVRDINSVFVFGFRNQVGVKGAERLKRRKCYVHAPAKGQY